MSVATEIVRTRSRRKGLLFAVGIVAFFAAYTWLLDYQEAGVKAHLAELRMSNPDLYLSQIRTVVTFEQYLADYRTLKDYQNFRGAVPEFLLGRWALFPEAKRVSDFYFADNCTNSVAFEDGLVKTVGELISSNAAQYRLDGTTVTLKTQLAGEFAVNLVSYGVRLHHIELTMPGYDGPRYGYLCK